MKLLAGDHIAERPTGAEAPDQIMEIGTVDIQNFRLVRDIAAARKGIILDGSAWEYITARKNVKQ